MTYINELVLRLAARRAAMTNEEGQGLTEYGLIIALIAVACVAALGTLSGGIQGTLEEITSSLGG